jgi:mRNA interferase HigB
MRIISKRTLRICWEKHPDSEYPLLDWHDFVIEQDWSNPNDVKKSFGNASILDGNRVIFNIKGNDYRLITHIDYVYKMIFIIWVGTHRDYDKINASTIQFKRK